MPDVLVVNNPESQDLVIANNVTNYLVITDNEQNQVIVNQPNTNTVQVTLPPNSNSVTQQENITVINDPSLKQVNITDQSVKVIQLTTLGPQGPLGPPGPPGPVGNPFPFTGSAIISGSLIVTGSIIATQGFTGSLLGTSSYALTASYVINGGGDTNTGSLLTTASVNLNTITFTKGDGSTFPITVNTGSGGGGGSTFPYTGSALITGSLIITGSTVSTLGFTGSLFGTASYSDQALSSSYALTASFALNGGGGSTNTGSLLTTASVNLNTITFTKGDGSTFPITVNTGSNNSTFPYTGSALITGSLAIIGSTYISGSSGSALLRIDSNISSSILFVSGSGFVGIGTTSYLPYNTSSFTVNVPTILGEGIVVGAPGFFNNGLIEFYESDFSIVANNVIGLNSFNISGVPAISIRYNSGYVGIGTGNNEPQARLHVSGTTKFEGDMQVSGSIYNNGVNIQALAIAYAIALG